MDGLEVFSQNPTAPSAQADSPAGPPFGRMLTRLSPRRLCVFFPWKGPRRIPRPLRPYFLNFGITPSPCPNVISLGWTWSSGCRLFSSSLLFASSDRKASKSRAFHADGNKRHAFPKTFLEEVELGPSYDYASRLFLDMNFRLAWGYPSVIDEGEFGRTFLIPLRIGD